MAFEEFHGRVTLFKEGVSFSISVPKGLSILKNLRSLTLSGVSMRFWLTIEGDFIVDYSMGTGRVC